MPHRLGPAALAALVVLGTALPAHASSMPRADFGSRPYLGLGLGNGVSLSFDAPLNRDMSLGASLGTGFVYSRASSVDVRFLYKLLHGGAQRPFVDLLVGVQGGGVGFALGGFEPMVGVGLAYAFTPQLTLRGNIVAGLGSRNVIGPSGIELGYKFSSTLEGTIGGNGRGDFIGLKFNI